MNFQNTKHLTECSKDEITHLQLLLNKVGYSLVIDGTVGDKTLGAFKDFKRLNKLDYPEFIGATTYSVLLSRADYQQDLTTEGLELIKEFEGLRLEAYLCEANVASIGYGSTRYLNGSRVKLGDTISKEYAEKLLLFTLDFYKKEVRKLVKQPITDNQFSALVSLTYNIGINAFRNSTLLKYLNQGLYQEVGNEFIRWSKIGDKISQGLLNRRNKERVLWLKK